MIDNLFLEELEDFCRQRGVQLLKEDYYIEPVGSTVYQYQDIVGNCSYRPAISKHYFTIIDAFK